MIETTTLNLCFIQLDSATSLIQASKNLMNAVVLAVKASYVASTKYARASGLNVGDLCTSLLYNIFFNASIFIFQ